MRRVLARGHEDRHKTKQVQVLLVDQFCRLFSILSDVILTHLMT